MMSTAALPWVVIVGYGILVWLMAPRSVSTRQFFQGGARVGDGPGLWLLVASAAITWLFAKSFANAAILSDAFGIAGGVGYALYYLSFFTAAVAIYFIRVRGRHRSLAGFLESKYGGFCAKLFLIAIAIRLFNEVWSNTKVAALFFGSEGSTEYWVAVAMVTGFTIYYSYLGGLRSSLLTDGVQMLLAAVLLVFVLLVVWPGVAERGLPPVRRETTLAGVTFCGLALVQVMSYPFHDPVLTDRAFITSPKVMVRGFVLAGLIAGGFILIYSGVGLYALAFGIAGNPSVHVSAALGLPMMLVMNAIMLTSAGSTLDSTFASTAKLAARDWSNQPTRPTHGQVRLGRVAMLAFALLGNLPLLSIYLGDKVGPAIISATTISGTMVLGLAPIFLLSFIRSAGPASFHLAFWPGLLFGVLITAEGVLDVSIFPGWIDVGTGKYADDLGINLYGLAISTGGYLAGSLIPGLARHRASHLSRRDATASLV